MKKILSLVLAVMMIVALGAVSLPAMADEEPVLITYYTQNSSGEQEYTQQVADKLSELLQAKGINVKMELHPYAGDYKTGFTLAQTSGQQIDIFTTYALDFTTEVENGSVMPLDDLLAAHPETVAEVPEWLVKMGRVGGTQYYIPSYQQATNGYYFMAPNAYLEAANLTIEDVRYVSKTVMLAGESYNEDTKRKHIMYKVEVRSEPKDGHRVLWNVYFRYTALQLESIHCIDV